MRIGFDTNVLVYLAGIDRAPADSAKVEASLKLHEVLAKKHSCIAPLQTLGELYVVLQRVWGDRDKAYETVIEFQSQFESVGTNSGSFVEALRLATDHKLQFWDALIVNAAADAGCALLLSEDMQSGFSWRGVMIANPFAEVLEPQLRAALAG